MPNPLFGQPGKVESFAFVRGCEAPAGQLDPADLAQCTAILASFHPSPIWANGPVNRLMRFYALMGRQIQIRLEANSIFQFGEQSIAEYQRTENVIANWGNQMRQMQMQQFAQGMASNYHVTEGWMNALTGRTDLYDPQNGKIYNVDTNFQSYDHYCKAPGAPVAARKEFGSCGLGQVTLRPHW